MFVYNKIVFCRCFLSGWGTNSQGNFQPILREVDLPIVDDDVCEVQLQRTRLTHSFRLDKNSFLCAGGEFGKDACTVIAFLFSPSELKLLELFTLFNLY